MGAFTNYLENKLLDHVLKNTSYTPPTTVYVALHTADPTEAGNVGEISGGGYIRKAATFAAAADGATSNTNKIEFPVATGNWGTITHISIWDAESAGNPLFYGALTASKTIGSGDQFIIQIGDLDVSVD